MRALVSVGTVGVFCVGVLAVPASAHDGHGQDGAPHDIASDDAASHDSALTELSWQDEAARSDDEVADTLDSDGLVIDFADSLDDDDIAAIERETGLDLTDTTQSADGNLWLLRGPAEVLARAALILSARIDVEGDVEGVEENVRYALFDQALERGEFVPADGDKRPPPTKPNDPMYKSQWHFDMVRAESAWATAQGEGVVVAVVDTGVSPGTLKDGKPSRFKRVPDLKETPFVAGFNFVNNNADPSDGNGHGTHVAGTIAQSTHNNFGVAGLAYKAKIMPIKVLSDGGSGTVADIANGIRFAADHGAKVINMSLGGGMYSATLAKAVLYAHDKGVFVACAAGNGARQKVEYPAAYPGCVAVSALGPDGKLAFYSSYGKELDIAAPGGDTRVDLNKDGLPDGVLQDTIARGDPTQHGFFPYQGTSMATPHVAAAAALVMSTGVTDPDRVEKVLKSSSKDLKDPIRFGAGGLDAAGAVKKSHADHGVWGLAASLGVLGLALRSSRKRDPMGSLKLSPAMIGAAAIGSGAWLSFVPFGAGALGGVFALVAVAIPVVGLALFFGVKRLRPVLAGLALGLAGFALVRAGLGSVNVALVPGHGILDGLWLIASAGICFMVGKISLARH